MKQITLLVTVMAWASYGLGQAPTTLTHYDLTLDNGTVYPVYKESIEISKNPLAVSSVVLSKNTSVELIRGNTFELVAGETLGLHPNGMMSYTHIGRAIQKPQKWILEDRQEVLLTCGKIRPNSMQPHGMMRVLKFYDNGEYERGCDIINQVEFTISNDKVKAANSAKLELQKSGKLKYASRVSSGTVVVNGKELQLQPGSEIYYHSDKQIDFFTMKAGQSFTSETVQFGNLEFIQPERTVSVSIFKDGQIKRAIVNDTLEVGGLTIAPGSGLMFDKFRNQGGQPIESSPAFLASAVLSEPAIYKTADGYEIETKLPGFNMAEQVVGIVVNKAFVFTHPETGKKMTINQNARVHLKDGVIVAIENTLSEQQKKQLDELKKMVEGNLRDA